MNFLLIGLFKPGAQTHGLRMSVDWNEHLAQRPLRIAGPLLDESGGQRGWMAVLTTESLDAAQAFLHSSPYFEADLYERVEVFELAIEVGRVD
jgi:hypothetical protein